MASIIDGTSNTGMFAETTMSPYAALSPGDVLREHTLLAGHGLRLERNLEQPGLPAGCANWASPMDIFLMAYRGGEWYRNIPATGQLLTHDHAELPICRL